MSGKSLLSWQAADRPPFQPTFPSDKIPNCHQRIQNAEKPWRKEVSGVANGPPVPSGLTLDETEEAFLMRTTGVESALFSTYPDRANAVGFATIEARLLNQR
jgi:hypothetical protein